MRKKATMTESWDITISNLELQILNNKREKYVIFVEITNTVTKTTNLQEITWNKNNI